jgi:SAM-dependent methyltransferase
MKINIGCGRELKEGWINADNTRKEKTLVWQKEMREEGYMIIDLDATKPWPYDDEIFDYVFSEHMIEHVPGSAGLFMLQEAYRSLKPGGVIRIACPERTRFEQMRGNDKHPYVKEYFKVIFNNRPVRPGSANRVVHRTLNEQGHVWVPTVPELIAQIQKAGFTDVKEVDYGVSEHEELNRIELLEGKHAELRKFETISVEGTK